MLIKDFIKAGADTAIYPNRGDLFGMLYCCSGLIGEVGECFNVLKKSMRDDDWKLTEEKKGRYINELGGIGWYSSQIFWEGENASPGILKVDASLEEFLAFDPGGDGLTDIDPIRAIHSSLKYMLSCCNNIAVAEDEFLLKMDEKSGDTSTEEIHGYLKAMIDNASEILYTVGVCAYYLGVPIMEIINTNFNLLSKRKDAGTLKGSGDGVRRTEK